MVGVGGGYAGDGGWWAGGWWRVGVRWVDGDGGGGFFLKHKLCIFWQHQTKQTARLPRTARHIAQEASNSAAMEATQPSQWAPRRRRGPVNIGFARGPRDNAEAVSISASPAGPRYNPATNQGLLESKEMVILTLPHRIDTGEKLSQM